MGFLSYFTDPVLRGPMIGSILMSLAASLVGVIVLLRRQSLIGEALSHAAYPGVVFGVVLIGVFLGDSTNSEAAGIAMLTGAFLTAMLGFRLIRLIEVKGKTHSDAALCFVLSFFFGIGIALASHIQFSFSNLFRQVQIYFYGQAATMTDTHIFIYGALALFVFIVLLLFRKEYKAWLFDPFYARSLGMNIPLLEKITLVMVTLSIVIGIRSVGVVLMSAMLIAPAVAARQCTYRLKEMFLLAAVFGMVSASLGTYLANEWGLQLGRLYPDTRLSLPTGPMIVLAAAGICILTLLFAPQKGMLVRLFRILKFRKACLNENILKTLWRVGPSSFSRLKEHLLMGSFSMMWTLIQLKKQGWIEYKNGLYFLTKDGFHRASHIVRLHRLWELYLADYVGIGASRVHASAEEMEHILTPEIEEELNQLLNNPTKDPHSQPIPAKEI